MYLCIAVWERMVQLHNCAAGWKKGARLHDCTAGWVEMLLCWDNEWEINI